MLTVRLCWACLECYRTDEYYKSHITVITMAELEIIRVIRRPAADTISWRDSCQEALLRSDAEHLLAQPSACRVEAIQTAKIR
jgi:hypothetical protein